MKRYLNLLLCSIIVSLSVFAMFRIDTKAKVVDKIYVTNNNKVKIETIKYNVAKASIVEKYVPKSIPTSQSIKVTKKSVKYGTFGRLYVSGYSVPLYDYNVNTTSNYSLQTIVNNQDSAAYYINHGKLIIADHNYQGFNVLSYLNEGSTSHISFEDGSIVRYRLIKKSRGYNAGSDLIDTNGNSFFNMKSDLIMYTCYEDGIMVTLWELS